MNKWNKKSVRMVSALSMILTLLMICTLPVLAQETMYRTSMKAGSKGTIRGGQTSLDMYSVAGEQIDVDSIQALLVIQEGYYFTEWEPQASGLIEVTESRNYVAQYARIINEAVYSVNYVDTAGTPVATQKVAITNQGANVSEQALQVEGYAVNQAVKSIVVDQKKGNEITFTYTSTTQPNVVVETETITLPGGTTITTVQAVGTTAAGGAATTPAATTTAGATAATTPAGATTTTAGTTPAGATPDGATTTTPQGATAVQAPDEATPQANIQADNTETNKKEGTVEAKDEETPGAKKDVTEDKSLAYGILLILTVGVVGYVVLRYVKRNNS